MRYDTSLQVITPPEFANMQPYITIDQLNSLAAETIQASHSFCCIDQHLFLGLDEQHANTLLVVCSMLFYRQDVGRGKAGKACCSISLIWHAVFS